ncbi:hypothetical protein PCANC_26802 [Puccinia coronata f. sp. avenae]|uniref:Uncharacterized protein n=1 Tax=Puccinia coronata f. sp. avenae TaxID=200324 RepID=A0A2N5SIS3_9BASI|nr:hypothetical protein PCANC_26802 [Puccinia coronata f. sp. avenae]
MPTDFLAFHFPQVSTSHLPAILNRFIHHSSYSMALNRTPNHPAYMSGLFETLGKFMPLNNGSVPTLTYMQEAAAVACPSGAQPFSFTNKATVNSLGSVVSRKELVLESVKGTSHLAVIMFHNDWDSQEHCHQQFNIKYIGPGTKLHVKTFGLYVVGRELKVVGRLVDFNMDSNMAVVVVAHVSVTTGHQSIRSTPLASASSSPSGKNGQTFTSSLSAGISSADAKPKQPVAATPLGGKKGKGKAAATHNRPPKEVDTNSNSDKFDEESEPEVKPKPRGRPRKDVLKDAAKRMKKA